MLYDYVLMLFLVTTLAITGAGATANSLVTTFDKVNVTLQQVAAQ